MNQISQSAASQRVRHLEEELGTHLIDRRKRPLLLTPLGEVCYQGLCDVLRQYDTIRATIDASQNRVEGSVRVAAIYSVGLHDTSRAMREFMTRYPKANVQLEYHLPDAIYRRVRSNEVDLGIVSYPQEGLDLRAIPIRSEEMVLVSHPHHHLATCEAVEPSQLHGEDFVLFSRELAIARELDAYFRTHGVSIRKVMQFDNVETIKQAVEVGAGLSILPQPTIRREVERGSLRAISLKGGGLQRPIGIVHHHQKVLTPAILKLIEVLTHFSATSPKD